MPCWEGCRKAVWGKTSRTVWCGRGMEKYYGEPKRAQSWKRWIQPRGYLMQLAIPWPYISVDGINHYCQIITDWFRWKTPMRIGHIAHIIMAYCSRSGDFIRANDGEKSCVASQPIYNASPFTWGHDYDGHFTGRDLSPFPVPRSPFSRGQVSREQVLFIMLRRPVHGPADTPLVHPVRSSRQTPVEQDGLPLRLWSRRLACSPISGSCYVGRTWPEGTKMKIPEIKYGVPGIP